MSITRRDFLGTGATVAAGLTLGRSADALPIAGAGRVASAAPPVKPVVIASANGIRGVARAYEMITKGSDTLDAIIAGVNIQELDPEDQSVGLGGLPNADGVVQLDASCMHGPTKRAGAVAALEDIATPSLVAKAVMDHTDHILLVGAGAKRFALEMGFQTQNLLTEKSRQDWLRWRSRFNPNDNWLDSTDTPAASGGTPTRTSRRERTRGSEGWTHDGLELAYDERGVPYTYGTINMNAVAPNGDISSVTTTSGLSWKIPGRVGDSPIIGAGQYCDNEVGAA
ncbi:MAG TPA: isoaspartyl peptidase/L-asparaginase, partial [Gemmatimonadaceae bacterium]|nr:isoaspartyl peptidase/L-asparaginase [Gemmatimonadaceae bacterium]